MFSFSTHSRGIDLEVELKKFEEEKMFDILDSYGEMGVSALSSVTPVDTGKTASLWSYKKVKTSTGYSLEFWNSNVNKGVPIAIILQYGHGTGTGGYVQGQDYINPTTKVVFDLIVSELTKAMSG